MSETTDTMLTTTVKSNQTNLWTYHGLGKAVRIRTGAISGNSSIRKVFEAHTVTRQLVVCCIMESTASLRGLSLTDPLQDFEIKDVVDAAHVLSSSEESMLDIVVLLENLNLELYRGNVRLCALVHSFERPIKHIQNGRAHCVTAIFDDESSFAVSVMAQPVGLSEPTLAVLKAMKDCDALFGLVMAVDLTIQLQAEANALQHERPDWNVLLDTIRQALFPGKHVIGRPTVILSNFERLRAQAKNATPTDDPVSQQDHALLSGQIILQQSETDVDHMLSIMLESIHVGYEDCKLDVLKRDSCLPLLGNLLGGLVRAIVGIDSDPANQQIVSAYDDFYTRDLGAIAYRPYLFSARRQAVRPSKLVTLPPPDVFLTLSQALNRRPVTLVRWKGMSAKLVLVFSHLGRLQHSAAIQEMVTQQMTISNVETFPMGIQLVVREMLRKCRENPPPPSLSGWPKTAYTLIGREDVYNLLESENQIDLENDEDASDFAHFERYTKLRFGRDRRVQEAFRLVDSSIAPVLVVKKRPEMTDHDLIKAQQVKLRRLVAKSMSGTLGHGAMTLRCKSRSERLIRANQVVKSGRLPPSNLTIQLDDEHTLNATWPNFHNGVAVGLARRMLTSRRRGVGGRSGAEEEDAAAQELSRTWILFNKPSEPSETHAGLLLALGLSKDLACLTKGDLYERVKTKHDPTTIAVLLGMGCAKAGTGDSFVWSMLGMHVLSLLPTAVTESGAVSELDVSSNVQCAALLGLGLLYRGTSNRHMCEVFLGELGKGPNSDLVVDERESLALSCGLGLGLVALGCGAREGGLAGLADLDIEERLHAFATGGPRDEYCFSAESEEAPTWETLFYNRRSVNKTDHSSGSNGATGSGGMGGSGGSSGLGRTSGSTRDGLMSGADREPKCARVLEGSHMNTDITGPGAFMALGLIFLKSNDESVGDRLSVPSTRFHLENNRPDMLMYRIWAKSLVMWDHVRPSEQWIWAQIPTSFSQLILFSSNTDLDPQDVKYFRSVRAYIFAGAALGLGTRFAGTALKAARNSLLVLWNNCHNLMQDVDELGRDAFMSCVALGLGMIMAGTGDLSTLRALRSFRKEAKRYSANVASSMSLGFLFLGGGKMSFSTSNQAVAALVCSVFPRFPSNPGDNSAHLQAARHLYVLAAEPRCVQAFDSETGQACYAPLTVTLKANSCIATGDDLCEFSCAPNLDDSMYAATTAAHTVNNGVDNEGCAVIHLTAPALLPPLEWIQSIRVDSPRFWPLTLNSAAVNGTLTIYVKLRAHQLSYLDDPRGLSSLSARPKPSVAKDLLGTLGDFSEKSPLAFAFARQFPDGFETLYACLLDDSLESISAFLEIARVARNPFSSSPSDAEQIIFAKKFLRKDELRMQQAGVLFEAIHSSMAGESYNASDMDSNRSELREYLMGKKHEGSERFYVYLNLIGIPKLAQCQKLGLIGGSGASGGVNVSKNAVAELEPDALFEICDACFR